MEDHVIPDEFSDPSLDVTATATRVLSSIELRVAMITAADLTLDTLPLAFAVTFLARVTIEWLVSRYLCKRPPGTLLATLGTPVALQQIDRNVFGTQGPAPDRVRLARQAALHQ